MPRKIIASHLGVSLIALSLAATPAFAQDGSVEEQQEAQNSEVGDGVAVVAIGGMVAGGIAMERGGTNAINTARRASADLANAAGRQATGLDDLQRRGQAAQRTRGVTGASNGQMDDLLRRGDAARTARRANIGSGANLDELARRGEAARTARRPQVSRTANLEDLARRGNGAQQARAGRIGNGANLDDLARRGNAAQQARGPRIGNGANLDDLARRGNVAQQARTARIGNGANLSDLARRGNAAQTTRGGLRSAANAAANGPGFERGLARQVGQPNVARLVNGGDAAQLARGRMVNEGQLMRNITNNGGNITDLNRQGRAAQAARRVDTASDIGRAAGRADQVRDAARIGRVASRVDDVADIARAARIAGSAGRAGRAALASTGVGALVVAAEIVGTESVRALTGVELQDPISTGAMYGAALFSKDISLAEVAQMRREHHLENFQRLHETLTTPGQLGENLREYGQMRAEDIREFGENVQEFRHNSRDFVGNATGAQLDAPEETVGRYAEAMQEDNSLQAVAEVAADRARHHTENVGRVGGKVACGIGNIFRKKENDRDC